jgi:pimeloyl-ACP methyl ester carboxylesterase
MAFAEIDGARLAYEWSPARDTGSGTPTIVFLHEGLGSIAQWRDFPQKLSTACSCNALVYSRRGHGHSAPRAGPHTPRFMHLEAEVLSRLLQELEIARPVLFGHSDGGSIALLYAAMQGNANPPRGLIVEAPHVFVEDRSIAGIEAAREAYEKSGLREGLARYHDDADHTFRGWNDIWLAAAFRAWNIEDCLSRIRCPVLAIQGFDDVYGTMAQIDAIAARVPGEVSLLKLAQCGHAPHREQTAKTLESSRRMVRQLLR